MDNRIELLRGTEEEVRNEYDNRISQGYDGTVSETAHYWVLSGTPEEWYQEQSVNSFAKLTNGEIWDGWCGSASPQSDEGDFESEDDVREYVAGRMRDWANELISDEDEEEERYICNMTDDEIDTVVNGIWNYYLDNK